MVVRSPVTHIFAPPSIKCADSFRVRMKERLSSRRPKTRGHVVIRTILLKVDVEDVASAGTVLVGSELFGENVVIVWSGTDGGDIERGSMLRADRMDPCGMSGVCMGGGSAGGQIMGVIITGCVGSGAGGGSEMSVVRGVGETIGECGVGMVVSRDL
jgi:hypothetical protein